MALSNRLEKLLRNYSESKLSQELFLEVHEEYKMLEFSERYIFGTKMRSFFYQKNFIFDKLKYYDYFFLYADWCWLNLNDQDRESIDSEIYGRQVPVAAMNGYDLIEKTLSFLWFKSYDKKDLENLFTRIKQSVISSEALVGKDDIGDYVLKDLVSDVKKSNLNNDSMETANFWAKLEKILANDLPVPADKFFLDSVENVAKILVNFTNFVLGIESDKIWYVCDLWAHPEKYDNAVEKNGQNTSNFSTEDGSTNKSEEVSSGYPTHDEIIELVKNSFLIGDDGQFLDVEKVLEKLDALAGEYGDDSIRDLYYFNESTGKFEWKE